MKATLTVLGPAVNGPLMESVSLSAGEPAAEPAEAYMQEEPRPAAGGDAAEMAGDLTLDEAPAAMQARR